MSAQDRQRAAATLRNHQMAFGEIAEILRAQNAAAEFGKLSFVRLVQERIREIEGNVTLGLEGEEKELDRLELRLNKNLDQMIIALNKAIHSTVA